MVAVVAVAATTAVSFSCKETTADASEDGASTEAESGAESKTESFSTSLVVVVEA